jgi:hypothetical protein
MNLFILIILEFVFGHNLFLNGNSVAEQDNSKYDPAEVAEKVYLHIDREYYNPGEDIWFKAYVIDASTNKPSPNTNNLHVELISPVSKIIRSQIVRIEAGVGNGDFHLTDSIPSGRYMLRAYTNHMRNFDDHFFFNKEIFLINPQDGGNGLNDSIKYIENKISISFFPEGGSIVDNVNSVVAFKAENAIGKGVDMTGELFSSKGDLISTFKSSHLGMGYFSLKPIPGLNYYTVIKSNDGAEYRTELPKSFSTGVAIHALVIQDNKILLVVSTNQETLPSVLNHELAFSISSRNLTTKISNIKISSLISNFIIPVGEFPDGILRVTLSGIEGIPLCERLVYFQKNKNIKVEITTDKAQYQPRERVNFNISLSGDSGLNEKTFLSLSVAEKGTSVNSSAFPRSIASWFLLESDVRGPVEEPSWYFDISNEARFQDLDLLLLTQGWRDFQWKYDSPVFFKHEIGFSLTGRARRILSTKPYKGAKINIGIFGDNAFSFLSAEPDSTGRFGVNGIDITGIARAVVSVSDKNDQFSGLLIIDSLFYKPAAIEVNVSHYQSFLLGKYSELKQEAIVKNSIRKKYKLSDTIDIEEVFVTARKREQSENVHVSRSSYIKPDQELIVTPDMETRPDISALIAGRIPGVEVSGTTITVRGQTPLTMVDGIPNVDIYMVPPYMIDRIDVLYWSSLFGSRGANGIINIITKRGDINYTDKPESHSANIKIKGFDAPRIFYSPKYSAPDPSAFLPDTRNTIFWEPNIIVGKGQNVLLSCFNADKATPIEIIVEGITGGGIPVTGKARYEVK